MTTGKLELVRIDVKDYHPKTLNWNEPPDFDQVKQKLESGFKTLLRERSSIVSHQHGYEHDLSPDKGPIVVSLARGVSNYGLKCWYEEDGEIRLVEGEFPSANEIQEGMKKQEALQQILLDRIPGLLDYRTLDILEVPLSRPIPDTNIEIDVGDKCLVLIASKN